MKNRHITANTLKQARTSVFCMASVFYALLFLGQIGAIIEGIAGIVPGLLLCTLWGLGSAGCYLAVTDGVMEGIQDL